MKYPNCRYYVKVKDKRFETNPDEIFTLRKPKPPKSLRTRYQVLYETKAKKESKSYRKSN